MITHKTMLGLFFYEIFKTEPAPMPEEKVITKDTQNYLDEVVTMTPATYPPNEEVLDYQETPGKRLKRKQDGTWSQSYR